MLMICTNEQTCGWAGEIAPREDWVCPSCHCLILPEVEDEVLRVSWQINMETHETDFSNPPKAVSPAWNSDAED